MSKTIRPNLFDGLGDKMNDILGAFKARLAKVLQVIDDALESESLKDRAWAVDVLLKRFGLDFGTEKPAAPCADTKALRKQTEALSDTELLSRIRTHLDAPVDDASID